MAIVGDIVEGVIKLGLRLIIETIFFYTGEIVLYFFSLGRKKPRWDFYAEESPLRWAIFTEVSWWIGFLFWVFTIGWIARKLLT